MREFWHAVGPYVEVLLPTLVVALIFWYVMKAIFNADRHEREAERKIEQESDRRIEERAEQLRREAQVAARSTNPEYGEQKSIPEDPKN
jgi:flagellar biosynthesis/type III secretory pathway M-ring protein FliF/YscJ